MQSTTIAIPTYDHTHTFAYRSRSQQTPARECALLISHTSTQQLPNTPSLLRSLIHTPIDRSLAIMLEGASGRPRERERYDGSEMWTWLYSGVRGGPNGSIILVGVGERRGRGCEDSRHGEPVQKSNKKHLSF